MSTVIANRARVKPARIVRIVERSPQGDAVLYIAVGKAAAHYFVRPLPADFGSAYEVRKIGLAGFEPAYHVNLNGPDSSCECKGFLHHRHCKHVEGLAALRSAGRI
jgi:hypothetical protein